jgi:hypothetical protein
VTRLRSAADAIATFVPALTEPVKLTVRGVGWAVIAAPRASPPVTMVGTPGGRTRSRTSTLARDDGGG